MIIKEIKKIKNHQQAYELIKKGKIKFDCPILVLHQSTGFYYTRPLIVEGVKNECIQYLMDQLFEQYDIDELPFPIYTQQEILEVMEDIGDEYLFEYYFPLSPPILGLFANNKSRMSKQTYRVS